MSTYDAPYIYGRIPGTIDNSNTSKQTRLNSIKNWFDAAGWTITETKRLIKIVTDTPPTFYPCLLGEANDIFFGVGAGGIFQYVAVIDDSSCFDQGAGNKEGKLEELCEGEIEASYALKTRTPPGGLSGLIISDADDLGSISNEEWHNVILKITAIVANGGIYITTEETSPGQFTSWIEYDGPLPTFGGQLNVTVDSLGGVGFIATSESNIVNGNYMELYCYYEDFTPVTSSASNQIRFAMIPGRRLNPCTHPLLDHFNTNGSDHQIGVTAVDELFGFVGPYWFAFETEPSTSNLTTSTSIWGGAARLKSLEGEDTPDIIKAIVLAGTTLAYTSSNPDSFKLSGGVIPGQSFFWCEHKTIGSATFHGSSAKFSLSGLNNSHAIASSANYIPGIDWYGDIANIFEPWLCWNWFDPTTSSSYAPIFCMIPNSIHIWRRLDLDFVPTDAENNDVFYWDGQLWRYYQNNFINISGAFQPGMSTAFTVDDFRYYNGSTTLLGDIDYDGNSLATISDIEVSADIIPSGSSITITLTKTAGDVVIVRCSNKRISFDNTVVEFSGDTADVIATDNGLEIEEQVTIEVINKNNDVLQKTLKVVTAAA